MGYERIMDIQPEGVHQLVELDLSSESGYPSRGIGSHIVDSFNY